MCSWNVLSGRAVWIAVVLGSALSGPAEGSCVGAEAQLGQVRANLSSGQGPVALQQLASLSRSHSECPEVALLQAQVDAARGQPERAEAGFLRAIELAPGRPDTHFQLGMFYDRRQQHGRAAEQFRKVLAVAPKDPQAYDYLGLSLEAQGQFDKAESAYRMGLANNSGPRFDPMLHYNYGRLLAKQNRWSDARKHLDQAVKLAPKVRAVHYERAKLAERDGAMAQARTYAEQALKTPDPGGVILDMQVHYLLSRIYRALGEVALAARYTELSQKAEIPLSARQRSGR